MNKFSAKWKRLNDNDKWCLTIWLLFDVLLGLIIFLNANWFYLDAPYFLTLYKKIGIWGMFFLKGERFCPLVYTIDNILSAYISAEPTIHYMLQWLYWSCGMLIAIKFLGYYNIKYQYRIFCAFLMVMCTSFTENMFTLGKMELLLSVWLIIYFLAIYKILYAEKRKWYLIFELSILGAFITKETSLIMLAPVVMLIIYMSIWDRKKLKAALCLGLILGLNLIALQVYRSMYVVAGEYTTFGFSLGEYISKLAFYVKIHFDIIAIGVIGGIVCIINWFKEKKSEDAYLLIINLTGWGYLLAVSVFRWRMSYYIYPVAILFSLSFISVFQGQIKKKIKMCCLLIVLLNLVYAMNYNYKVATSQMDLGKTFEQSINSIIKHTNSDSKILVTSYDFYEEPIMQTKTLLEYYGEARDVIGVKQEINNSNMDEGVLALYGYTLEDYKELKSDCKPQIGDYILINRNVRNFRGDVRGVNPAADNIDSEKLFQILGVKAELVDKTIIERNWLSFSDPDFKQNTIAGYELWKVNNTGNSITGIYTDGWSGKEVNILNYNNKSNMRIYLRESASSWSGESQNSIQIFLNNEMMGTIQLDNQKKYIDINDYITEKNYKDGDVIRLVVEKTDIPSKYGRDDDRELGVMMEIEEQ